MEWTSGYADLVVAPDHSLYLSQLNHVYKQIVSGDWMQLPDGGWNELDTHPTKLYIDEQNNLYVTCRDFGVWFSNNSGTTWTNVSNGLPVYTTPFSGNVLVGFTDVQFDSNNTAYGINSEAESGEDRGIYKLNNPLATVNYMGEEKGFQIYPNPVTDFCWLSGTVDQAATVKIYNALGQSMPVALLDTLKVGENEFVFNMSSFPAGIYVVQVGEGNEVSEKKIIKK